MNEKRPEPLGFFGENARPDSIDRVCRLRFAFGFVYRRVCSCVDDDLRFHLAQYAGDPVRNGNVELGPAAGDRLTEWCQRPPQLPADLAVAASEQNSHEKTSA